MIIHEMEPQVKNISRTHYDLRKTVIKNVKMIRYELGLSQEDLAKRINRSVKYIDDIENEKRKVTQAFCSLIEKKFNISFRVLIMPKPDNFKFFS